MSGNDTVQQQNDAIYHQDADALQDATHTRHDGFYSLPDKTLAMHDGTLEKLTQDGSLIKRSSNELNYTANPLFAQKENGQAIPVYQFNVAKVDGFVNAATIDKHGQVMRPADNFAPVTPEAKLMITTEGHHYILVNEAYQKRSPEEFQAIMPTDAKIDQMIANGKYVKAESIENALQGEEGKSYLAKFEELKNYVAEEAGAIGHKNIKFLVAERQISSDRQTFADGKVVNPAQAFNSAENTEYIVVSRDVVNGALQSDKQSVDTMALLKSDIGHELTHIQRGDTTAQGLARANNNVAVARYEEAEGDLKGVIRSGQPEALARQVEDYLKTLAPIYQQAAENKDASRQLSSAQNPGQEDLKKLSDFLSKLGIDPAHPAGADRIEAIRETATLATQYEKTHKVLTAADREAEAQYVVPKVMDEMQGKWQLPVEAPKEPVMQPKAPATKGEPQAKVDIPHGLNASQMTDIMGMREMMAQLSQTKMDLTRAPEIKPLSLNGISVQRG